MGRATLRADRCHLVEVRTTFRLGGAVVDQPVFALKRWRRIRVQRLMPVEQDLALFMQELQRVQIDARKRRLGGQRRVWPAL